MFEGAGVFSTIIRIQGFFNILLRSQAETGISRQDYIEEQVIEG